MNLVQNCGPGQPPKVSQQPQQPQTLPLQSTTQNNGLSYQNGITSNVNSSSISRCSDRFITGVSCRALKKAVSALYSVDDFHRVKIGSGFFSEVYKVSKNIRTQIFPLLEPKNIFLAMIQDRNLSPSVRIT